MRAIALLAVGLWVATLAGNAAPAGRVRPTLADVSVTLPASSTLIASAIARSPDGFWFAAATNGTLRIYRWRGVHWVLDGTVRMPADFPFPNPSTSLLFTSVTGGTTPDFTAHAYGADTQWFALVAKVNGRWRVVPFDDQFRTRDPFTFAFGASHGLIEGIFDASGAAAGPTTFQWYRFAENRFVATTPPGGAAPCTSGALRGARHWFRIPGDSLLQRVARSLRIVRFACADGWAIATDGQDVGVYEQNGRRWVHSYRPQEHRWLRVGVGSPRLISSRTEFAMPASLFSHLARQIGVVVPRVRQPTVSNQRPHLPPRQQAPIRLRVRPGETYYPPSTLFDGQPSSLTVILNSPTGGRRIVRFRWHDGAWVPRS